MDTTEKRREYYRDYYRRNRDRYRAYNKSWRENNLERWKSYVSPDARARNHKRLKAWVATLSPEQLTEIRRKNWAKYYPKFRDKINARKRDRYDAEKALERRQAAKNADPEAYKLHNRTRRSIRRAREKAVTVGDLTDIAKVYERSKWWQQWFKVVVDHTIPITKGGTHEASNLQIIYDFENRRKYNRADYKPRVIFR